MANCMVFHNQIASIMEVLANSAVAEICKLVDDDYAVFRLEMTQSQKDNRGLRRKLQLLELKVARERAERTLRQHVVASRPNSVKILDRYRGMARGEGHLTGGHRSFVKPAGHNVWRDDQPIAIDERSGTSTQHVILIESANADAAGPGVKQERNEGEEDPQHSRDIQSGAGAGVAHPVVTEDLAAYAAPQARTGRSITEVLNSKDQSAKTQGGGATSGKNKDKPFLCMFCNKGFSCSQKVEIHQRIHTGVKPFSCTQCHMRFAQACNLKRHQRVHTGEKPYSCPQCEKRFSRQHQLKMHLKAHTEERSFTCTHCGKRFSESCYLRIHQQKNHSTL
ncbi:zinc finger protein 500-like isoform X2 [Oncorhynchus tshawytscha]|uniref:zinc finger protein 500-like isoform X2 n=1 Tax=Oncorhynchus tshawytscha TaxID=74940 RepID=UPI001C3CC31F|nr:zinc finger protein 500-like isoform X2 [Oncorhynchus tshawytscha]